MSDPSNHLCLSAHQLYPHDFSLSAAPRDKKCCTKVILKCYQSLLEQYSDCHAFPKRAPLIKLWRYLCKTCLRENSLLHFLITCAAPLLLRDVIFDIDKRLSRQTWRRSGTRICFAAYSLIATREMRGSASGSAASRAIMSACSCTTSISFCTRSINDASHVAPPCISEQSVGSPPPATVVASSPSLTRPLT